MIGGRRKRREAIRRELERLKPFTEEDMKPGEYKHLVSIYADSYCCQIELRTNVQHVANGLWPQIFRKIKEDDFTFAPNQQNGMDRLKDEVEELNKQIAIKDVYIAKLRAEL